MPKMLRKQIYINQNQDRLLKHRASELNITESELIRDGIDKVLRAGATMPNNVSAWENEKLFIHSLMKKGVVKGSRTWQRKDLYDR